MGAVQQPEHWRQLQSGDITLTLWDGAETDPASLNLTWEIHRGTADPSSPSPSIGSVRIRRFGVWAAVLTVEVEPTHRSQGVATEATRLVLARFFEHADPAPVVTVLIPQDDWAALGWARAVGASFSSMSAMELSSGPTWIGQISPRLGPERTFTAYEVPQLNGTSKHGEPFVMRAFDDSDLERIVKGCQDPEVQHYVPVPRPYTLQDAKDHLQECRRAQAFGDGIHWGVYDTSNRLMGKMSLFHRHSSHWMEVGYWTHPEGRGRGLTAAAARLAARHALLAREDGGLGAWAVRLKAATDNVGSNAVARSAGFRLIGEFLGDIDHPGADGTGRGTPVASLTYELTLPEMTLWD